MTLNLTTKILLMFGMLVVFNISNFVILLNKKTEAADQQQWVVHTHSVISGSENLLGFLRDAETGQRGFLLTNDNTYLEPYTVGIQKSSEQLENLRGLTQDNALQQARLSSIQKLMVQKTWELSETIRLTQDGKLDEAMAIVTSDVGKSLMDSIREHILEFKSEEVRLLNQRSKVFLSHQENINLLFYMEIIVTLFLFVGAVYLLQRILVQPIQHLTRSASKIAAGETVENLGIDSNDELGHLTDAFSNMQLQLQERAQALQRQAHFDYSFSLAVTACSSSRELTAVLTDALDVHSHHHDSPVSAIYLYDKVSDQLICAVAHAASDDAPTTVMSTTGLIGQAFSSNKVQIVAGDLAEGFHIDAGLASVIPRAIVLQPINYSGVTLGVFVAVYTTNPNKQDLNYISNLADQFGITIVGARQYTTLQELSLELEESHKKVEVQRDEAVIKSITDPLTGLNNRGYMQVELQRLIGASLRYGHELSLIILDIDHFKNVNDTLGHQAGDEVLKALANLLKSETRSSDLTVRYGGEEFVIILPECNIEKAREAAEKLREVVATTEIPAMGGKYITISLGIAMRDRDDDTMETIIGRADEALYQAKEEGRNQVCLAKPSGLLI